MTFACEVCGEPVTVAVRRAHKFCASCAAERKRHVRKTEEDTRRARKIALRNVVDQASDDVARILGIPPSPCRTRCIGCGQPFELRTYQGGMPKKWCSEACRQRVAVRGEMSIAGGYAHALVNDPCVYCGAEAGHIDHIEPSSKGGSNDWQNLASTCRECNARKKDLPLLRWLLARPLYDQLSEVRAELAQVA